MEVTRGREPPGETAIPSKDVRTNLDGIEVGGHLRWEGIPLIEDSDGRLTTSRCEIVPDLGGGDLTLRPLSPSLDPMPHADSALVPEGVTTRQQFWDHVYEQLVPLLTDQRAWVCHSPIPISV